MWAKSNQQEKHELVCYVFHHISGSLIDRSEIVFSTAGYAQEPKQETDDNGLPTWFLFRSIPMRLCAHTGECDQCSYVLGDVTFSSGNPAIGPKERFPASHLPKGG